MKPSSLVKAARAVARVVVREAPRNNFIHRWRRSATGDPGLPPGPIRSVLVLCHGNLFRSPFVESLLAANIPELRITSAGIHAADQHTSPDRAIRLAAEFGVDLNAHRTTPISAEILSAADLILVMEGAQRAELARLHPDVKSKVRVLGDFLDSRPRELPDPWSEDATVGRTIFRRVERAAGVLSERLRAQLDADPDTELGADPGSDPEEPSVGTQDAR